MLMVEVKTLETKKKSFIGIDLGTSAAKLLLVDEAGHILKTVSKDYPIFFPQPGWAEQNPADWWSAVLIGLEELLDGTDKSDVAGIGVGGQMHGRVILDAEDEIIRDAILWNDGRTGAEVQYLNNEIGKEKLSAWTANIAFAGFTAPKLLWLRKHEPDNFARISKIMLPKDFITYKLTGVHATDYSDASGMLLLDVKNKRWSDEMLLVCSVKREQMPRLFESYDTIGTVKPDVASHFGFADGVKVVAGAGDNAAAAIGTGVVNGGDCNISLGTSGTVFIASDSFGVDSFNALHSFAHASGGYHLMGCMLSAASCNKWFVSDVLGTTDYRSGEDAVTDEMLGENRVFFLPYLMGERSPINDTDARGAFIGMSMDTTRTQMIQAVLEGVGFAIRDSVEVARSLGIEISRSKICGGGAKSKLWKRMIANILNVTLESPATEQGPGMGGAMLAMVACGEYANVSEACEKLVTISSTVEPEPALVAKYEDKYRKFKKIYPSVKTLFKEIK